MLLDTPLEAAIGGSVAGLAATLLLSVLARVIPGMQNPSDKSKPRPRKAIEGEAAMSKGT